MGEKIMVDFRVHDVEKISYNIVNLTGCFVLRINVKSREGNNSITLFSDKISNLKFIEGEK